MYSIEFLNAIRSDEIHAIADLIPPNSRLLEIGAGTGQQARELSNMGHDVRAIDLAGSNYAEDRVFPIEDYDGRDIPAATASIDVVYTSNLLEHVRDGYVLHSEVRRILKPSGVAIHVVPSHSWRFWTTLTCIPTLSRPRVHGERGNVITEVWIYRPEAWRSEFLQQGFEIDLARPVGLFYTGNSLLGPRIPIASRRQLSRVLGSACYAFVLRPHSSLS